MGLDLELNQPGTLDFCGDVCFSENTDIQRASHLCVNTDTVLTLCRFGSTLY